MRKLESDGMDPIERARQKAAAMHEAAVTDGRHVVAKNAWARDLLEAMREAAPHVTDAALYRLFSGRATYNPEFLLGHARFLEYNATHPGPLAREGGRPGASHREGPARSASA